MRARINDLARGVERHGARGAKPKLEVESENAEIDQREQRKPESKPRGEAKIERGEEEFVPGSPNARTEFGSLHPS